jgi:lipopolysaccharide/colanic/teichoic acid biosynthesis glycosyltransferase
MTLGNGRGRQELGSYADAWSGRYGSNAYYIAKRAIDVVAAVVAAVPVAVVFLFIALAIKLDSSGPVIYSQQRLGARRRRVDGDWCWEVRPFTLYKFRTMKAGASSEVHEKYMEAYIAGDEQRIARLRNGRADTFKLVDDPRITRVGKILRRYSIDEIPQLINILLGHMSFVGPRPPLSYEVEKYSDWHFRRMEAPVGLTGWWQVNGRCETGFEDMVQLDLDYIQRRSILLDLKILLLTIPAVLSGRGSG